jgi:hypothetical protein
MEVPCTMKLEKLKEVYTLDSLDSFFSLEPGQTLHDGNVFDNEMSVYKGDEEVASIWLEVTEEDVYIHLLQRSSSEHRGIMRQLLYLIICKAIQLNLPITFRAVPSTSPSSKRVFEGKPKGSLYSYYETIGFTPANSTRANHSRSSIEYHTSVNTLKKIIKEWSASTESKGGKRKTKKRRHKHQTPL